MERFKIVVLALSGLALLYACSLRLINPTNAVFLQTYLENPANSLATDIDLVNEIRGIGAVMLLGAVVTLIGIMRVDFRQTAFVVVTVIFGGVVLGRSVSIVMDGMPNADLLRAASAEILLSILNIICLVSVVRQGNEL